MFYYKHNSKYSHQYSPEIALFVQIISLLFTSLLAAVQSLIALSIFEWSMLQGLLSGLISYYLRMPYWWIFINLVFFPLIITTLAFNISSLWFLLFFVCLLLIYGKTYKTRVPCIFQVKV